MHRYNNRVRGFPGSLVRRLGGFQPRGFFELSPAMSGSYEAAGMPARQSKDEAKTGDKSSAAAA